MKTHEEYILDAQELFESMNFGEYTVEGTDSWQVEIYKQGPVIAEAGLVVYLSHPDQEVSDPSEKGYMTVTFNSKTNLAELAYCVNENGYDIADINPKIYRAEKESKILERSLKEKQSKTTNKIKI